MTKVSLERVAQYMDDSPVSSRVIAGRLAGVLSRYREPWRHHHDVSHPLDLFSLLFEHEAVVKRPRVIAWTILYHDAIYDPQSPAGRNEKLSAELAEAELPPILGASEARLVGDYTRATAQHGEVVDDDDLAFFLDADVAILGAPSAVYDNYAAEIRAEYAHVPEEDYRLGRVAVLGHLSQRVKSGIFATPIFKDAYELQAQENIAREINQLQGG